MTRDELFEITEITRRLDRIEEHLEELREVARSAGSVDTTKERTTNADVRAGMAVADKIMDMESDMRSFKGRRDSLRAEARKLFAQLDGLEYDIMMRRYVDVLRWTDVSKVVGYDMRYIYRLHQCALDKLFSHSRPLP